MIIPVNRPFKVLDSSHLAGTNCAELAFTFDQPISALYIQGCQVNRYDDLTATTTYALYEGLGLGGLYVDDAATPWGTAVVGATAFTTLTHYTTPGFDGCAEYRLLFNITPAGHSAYDLVVLGIAA